MNSCDCLVAFLFDRMSQRIPPLRLFGRYIIMKNALDGSDAQRPDEQQTHHEVGQHQSDRDSVSASEAYEPIDDAFGVSMNRKAGHEARHVGRELQHVLISIARLD